MKKVEISEALETRIISKFLEISKKTNFTMEEALEEILDYLDQIEER
jgi:Asp-tRNA(Asn)/Glu-tRNA(Gln) amidotransferase C subunit